MKRRKSTLFCFRASIMTATLATLALASGTVSAAFIYHDTAATTGGTFSGFPIGNLKNAGHDSPTDTENASDSGESYATANPPTGGFPVTITLEFNSAVSLNKFYLWNHTNNGASGALSTGVAGFTMTFYDAAGGGGSQIGSVFSDTAAAAPTATSTYAAEEFDFGTSYADVRSVEFVITSRIGGGSSFVAAREIGFNAIPEPSSVLLGSFGLLALLRRRR